MTKVIGYEYSKGEFTSDKGDVISYDNIKIYTITDVFQNIVGCGSSMLKIKRDELFKLTGLNNPDDLLDKEIFPIYTPVGNSVRLTSIRIEEK
ncbi:MAG: hypothetical protein LUC25_07595 [Ruminococcus sp.]|nr:hypothetical protein [Ruminococcus sp.]